MTNNETQHDEKHTLILPCSGIGKTLGTLSRWTAYELMENSNLPSPKLLCLARLVVADEESKRLIQNNTIVTLDGCPKKCATLNVERNNGQVLKNYMMAKFLVKNRDLTLGTDVIDPGEMALELAKRAAVSISKEISELLEAQ
ncbi:MAG: putative zinc-binding protein [Promethearchaeota archaeon]